MKNYSVPGDMPRGKILWQRSIVCENRRRWSAERIDPKNVLRDDIVGAFQRNRGVETVEHSLCKIRRKSPIGTKLY